MSFKSNNVYLQGRINRIDARYGMTKANKEFMTVTFTLDIEGNLIKETYFDNTSKITDISDADNIIEKWYDNTGNNILFQRKTTINSDGSISESLI